MAWDVTEDSELREAPWCPVGARGPGGGSHGRLRGCPVPLLTTPLLADTAAETVDARTVKYLLQQTLAAKEEEEKRKLEADLKTPLPPPPLKKPLAFR